MTAAKADQRREHVPKGIVYMVAATLVFALSTAIAKWEIALYPVGEVAVARQLFSLIVCGFIILPKTGLAVFRTNHIGQHLVRGASQFTSQMCLLIALSMMSLGAVTAISFSSSLFATLFAMLFLGERVGIHRAAALIVGFVGVLLVTEPGANALQPGAVFALANAVLYGSVTVGVRRMGATESIETLTMYQMCLLMVLMTALLWLGAVLPTPLDGLLLALCGVLNGIGQYWWTRALHVASAPAVMPVYYVYIVWTMLIGFLIWGDVPTPTLLLGAAVVVASGIYLAWRENLARNRLLREAAASAVPARSAN